MQLAARGQHAVHKDTLVRVGAAAAIVAGLLRAAAAVAPGTDGEVERQSCISLSTSCLLGVLAAYAQHHKALGRSGAGAFLITSSRSTPEGLRTTSRPFWVSQRRSEPSLAGAEGSSVAFGRRPSTDQIGDRMMAFKTRPAIGIMSRAATLHARRRTESNVSCSSGCRRRATP